MDTQDYIRLREVESRQFQRGVRIMSRVTHYILIALYTIAFLIVYIALNYVLRNLAHLIQMLFDRD